MTGTGNPHITRLAAILGEKGLISDPEGMVPYETGARSDKGRALFVARPATTEKVSKVIAYCAANGIALIPQSGNTGLVNGSIPDHTGQQGILSVDRLRGVFQVDRINRSVTVSAGFRLSEINERLAEHGLYFPIDLGADPGAGGMVATNTGGSRFLRFGDVRRNTLGLQVVFADSEGSIHRFGCGLRKDNTGADWKQMFIGTGGAFGVITECTFNVERLPQQSATAYLVPSSDTDVAILLEEIEARTGGYLTAFEAMSGNAIRAALHHAPSLRNPFPGGEIPDLVLLVELSRTWPLRAGEQSLDDVLTAVLGEIWELSSQPLSDAFLGKPEEMWALRHALSEGVKASGNLVAFDLGFARGDVMRFRADMVNSLARRYPEVMVCDFGHVGDGGLHFNLVIPKGSPWFTPANVEELRQFVFETAVEKYAGSFSAEHGLGRRNQAYYDRYAAPVERHLSAVFKHATSPSPLGAAILAAPDA